MATKTTGNKRLRAFGDLAVCILLWAAIPAAAKKMQAELDNYQILFWSTALSTATLFVLLALEGKIKVFGHYGPKQYGIMALLGLLGNYIYYLLLYGALARTTASEGFILNYTWPIMVLVLSFFVFKDKVTPMKLVGILISFFGIIVVSTGGKLSALSFTSLRGDLLALGGAFVFALFSVFGKKYNFDKTVSVFVYFLAALTAVTPTVLLLSHLAWPGAKVWPWLVFNGVFINGISYIFWFRALEHGETYILSSLLYLTPFLSLAYTALFLGEKPAPGAVAGIAAIAAGFMAQYIKTEKSGRR